MSGHSKWSQIKRQKGVADQKKGQVFTKLGNAITIAVKEGGGITDPNSNFKLRLVIEKAKSANMPKENIQRAIERARVSESNSFEKVIYEGFGPAGIAVMVETATDNRQRTVQELKSIFQSFEGSLAGLGATSYLFQKMGQIVVEKGNKSTDDWMELAINVGAEDFEEQGNEIFVYTKPDKLHETAEILKQKNLLIADSELIFKPISTISVNSKEKADKILTFMGKLEENESVQKVFANFEMPDNLVS